MIVITSEGIRAETAEDMQVVESGVPGKCRRALLRFEDLSLTYANCDKVEVVQSGSMVRTIVSIAIGNDTVIGAKSLRGATTILNAMADQIEHTAQRIADSLTVIE